MFSKDELDRYARHIILSEVGAAGQQRLKDARVLVVGAGGLGSPALIYLAAAGVGTLGVVDDDRVEPSNLQRQILYGSGDLGRSKADAARARLLEVNPLITVEPFAERLHAENAERLVAGFDLVLDGSDNFYTRYLVNDACVRQDKPLVYGAISRFEGQLSVLHARAGAGFGPCYRCLFPEPPPPGTVPNCAEAGVLGLLPGVIGTMMAAEAVKLILGVGQPLVGRLLHYDALEATTFSVRFARNPACPACGDAPDPAALRYTLEACS